jgi:hypothetical protein
MIRFTSGALDRVEASVLSVPTSGEIILGTELEVAPTDSTTTFLVMRYVSVSSNSSGSLFVTPTTSGPLTYTRNGVDQAVTEDTVTPANNRPLPVVLSGVTGNITVTAQELNVQSSHTGASPDSMRIGDGVETVNVNASNEMQVADDTARTTLSTINGKIPALGQAAMAASSPVVIASNQSAVPVSAASLPLPTGAATEATLSTLNGKIAALGQALMSASHPVVIASNQSTLPVSAASLPLPSGAATEATLAAMSAKLPATLGQKTKANSLAVVLSSDSDALPTAVNGLARANAPIRNVYSSTNVTTAAYVQLVASTSAAIKKLQIFDSSGESLYLAVGAALSEVDQIFIFPGGNDIVDLAIPAGSRISVKSVSATISSGELLINCLG